MSKPIRLFKLVTGELVLGKFDEEANMLEDVAIIQVVPTQQGVQMMDDISLPVGVIRLRRKGSDGGQKGMRSIITLSGSDQFPRIKLGVGAKPHPDYDLAAWVLSRFTKEEAPGMVQAAHHAAEAAELIVQGRMEEAMNRYSG